MIMCVGNAPSSCDSISTAAEYIALARQLDIPIDVYDLWQTGGVIRKADKVLYLCAAVFTRHINLYTSQLHIIYIYHNTTLYTALTLNLNPNLSVY